MEMLDVEKAQSLRHQVRAQKRSMRVVARESGSSRNTVLRYVRGAEPGKAALDNPRPAPKTTKAIAAVAALLEELRGRTDRKQQLTAKRVHGLLRERGVDVGYSLVKEVFAEHRRREREVFVPLAYRPGELALVDFFEVVVDVDEPFGAHVFEEVVDEHGHRRFRVRAWLFLMRLPASGIDVVIVYPRQDQTCFLDGHVRAFSMLGGRPARIGYDNLKAAVKRMLVGSERELQQRFAALVNHYDFEVSFARPYTGHDKGAVEARGKGFRLQHMTPIPRGTTLLDVTHDLQELLFDDVDADMAHELECLQQLPGDEFDARKHRVVEVSRRSLVQQDGITCSVPEHLAQTMVDVHAGAFAVDVVSGDTKVTHLRTTFGGKRVDYRHYLKSLSQKPQAVRQVAHVLVPQLGEPFSSLWKRLLDEHDEIDAARALCPVLRRIHDVGFGEAARELEARAAKGGSLGARAPPPTPASSFTVPPALDVDVEASSVTIYDQLLGAAE